MKGACQIVICGDICPTPDTEALFRSGNVKGLFKNLSAILEEADFVVGNLECPLTNIGEGIAKCGPVLRARTECIKVMKAAGFGLLGVANNHIRDCGNEGVLSTLECCRENGILTVGAGKNAAAAKEPLIVEVEGWRIGFMAFAEHEFNAASEDQGGANLLDPFQSFDQLRQVRGQCDYLIVLYHGGIEHYPYPSPMLQTKCRKMVESGAGLVVCQHSHCVGTSESHNGGTILYGQGNTVYGYRPKSPDWNQGLIVRISLSENGQAEAQVEYLPILADTSGIDLMPPDRAAQLLRAISERSQRINDQAFVKESWRCFCISRQAHYLPLLLGHGRIANFANRKLKNAIVNVLFSRKRMRITMNLIRCEAHREVVQTILEDYAQGDS
jgi:poly-gamma-glutamate synthesis protein (capsule biosynthesis protein)